MHFSCAVAEHVNDNSTVNVLPRKSVEIHYELGCVFANFSKIISSMKFVKIANCKSLQTGTSANSTGSNKN